MQEYFISLFDYDKETGVLTWKERPPTSKNNNIFNSLFAGKPAGSVVTSNKSKTSYVAVKINGKSYKAHRIIFSIMTGTMPDEVDHIDHNGLNNKWENLRASNGRDNARNLPMLRSNKSGHIGVNWHKAAKKWQVRAVNEEGKRIDLGRYDSLETAAMVRKKYEKEFKYFEHRDNVNDIHS